MAARLRAFLLLWLSLALPAAAENPLALPAPSETAVTVVTPGTVVGAPSAITSAQGPSAGVATALSLKKEPALPRGPLPVVSAPPASASDLESVSDAQTASEKRAASTPEGLSSESLESGPAAPIGASLHRLEAPLPDSSGGGEGAKSAYDGDWSRRLGEQPTRVWVAASEAVPFIKSGGLADVTDGLSRELAASGHQITLVLPKYKSLDLKGVPAPERVAALKVPFADDVRDAVLWRTRSGGMEVLFIENDAYFGREGLYGSSYGDHPDNDERFLFFSKAFFEAARALGKPPDIVHAHDWPTGLVPALLALQYAADPFFARTASVFTVHNMAYQGLFSKETALKAFSPADLTPERLEYYDKVSYLKAGIALADKVTTVSRTYAKETLSSNAYGRGMEGLLRHRGADYSGIVNGLDPAAWDPARDPELAARYDAASWKEGKAANKAALQKAMGLPQGPGAPLFGVAARLDPQKGLDLIAGAVPLLRRLGAQLALVGNGSKELTELFQRLQKENPETVAAHTSFSEALARRIYAASDFYLMPSRFEPCGLSQLIAMRYGTLPLVTPTGGLLDTVVDHGRDPEKATGLILGDDSQSSLEAAILKALALWRAPPERERLVRNLMSRDSSWKGPAAQYAELYQRALAEKRAASGS